MLKKLDVFYMSTQFKGQVHIKSAFIYLYVMKLCLNL